MAMDGSNHAAVAFGIDDLNALKAMLSSVPPEMAAQAESHGVIMPMTVYVQAWLLARARSTASTASGSPMRRSLRRGDSAGTGGCGPADGMVKGGLDM